MAACASHCKSTLGLFLILLLLNPLGDFPDKSRVPRTTITRAHLSTFESSVRLPNTVVCGRSYSILHNPSDKHVLSNARHTKLFPAHGLLFRPLGTTTHRVLEILIPQVDLEEVGGCQPGHHGEIIIPHFSPCSTYGRSQFLMVCNPFN